VTAATGRHAIPLGACAVLVGCGGGASYALPDARTTPSKAPAANRQTAMLSHVRVAGHDGYDRVVFAFGNAQPGYDVRFVPRPVRSDGSGRVVSVRGRHLVRVRIAHARADGARRRIPARTPEVVQVVRSGDHEGVVTYVVGLRDRAPFRVTTPSGPPRVVVDFRTR
jgi:hypothetical protein